MLSPCFVSARYDERSTQMEADGGIECHVVMRAYGDLAKDEEGEVISDEAAYNRTEVQGGDWTPPLPLALLPYSSTHGLSSSQWRSNLTA